MVIDDHPENLRLIESYLEPEDYRVTAFPSGALALAAAQRHPPDLILLDIRMPDLDGFEVCRRLKADPRLASIPVIFLSGVEQTDEKVKGFQLGCVDYVMKPVHRDELCVRVRTHLKLRALTEALEAKNQELTQALQRITELATKDPLTNLNNRRAFSEELLRVSRLATRHERPECLVFIDLDHFKQINDAFGHDGGDHAIIAASQALRALLRDTDAIGRWGGEEFLVLLRGTPLSAGHMAAERMRRALAQCTPDEPFSELRLTGSFGVAEYVAGESIESWVQRADQACYTAKNDGRNCVCLADSD